MNELLDDYLLQNSLQNIDERIQKIQDRIREEGIPTLRTNSLNALNLLVKLKKPKKILEFGTAHGCSGVSMLLNASKNAELYTVEKNPESFEAAKVTFGEFGMSERVHMYLGDAVEIVKEIDEKFDFVFLDCNKSAYKVLLPEIKKKLKKNGVLVADNVLYRGCIVGGVEPPKKQKSLVKNIEIFFRAVMEDKKLQTTILNFDDGMSVSIKK